MANSKSIIASGVLAIAISMGTITPALATPVEAQETITTKTEQDVEKIVKNGDTIEQDINAIVPESVTDFSAQIYIIGPEETEVIEVSKKDTELSEALRTMGMKTENFKGADNEKLDGETIITNNSKIMLFHSKVTGESEIIELTAIEIEEETDELYVGETKVKQEGVNGEAIKTIITTEGLTDLSSDSEEKTNTTIEEKLTITKQPEAKIVLVGTKEIEPEIETFEETVNTNGITTTSNSTIATSNSSVSGNSVRTTNTVPSASQEDAAQKAVNLALSQVGKKYVWGTYGPDSYDCSGLVYWAYELNGNKKVGRTPRSQGAATTPVALKDIRPGDVLWDEGHIAIYIGNNKIVHASTPTRGVVVDDMSWYLNTRGMQIGRFE